MPGNITSADASYVITVGGVFTSPVQLQRFSADDIYGTEPIETGELSMGVDGKLSSGYIFVPIKQTIMLQADSPSNAIFDAWNAAERTLVQKLPAQGIITLRSIGTSWACINGFLTSYLPIPDAKKILQPRKFGITWELIQPAPV
jgi:hypothetical protein